MRRVLLGTLLVGVLAAWLAPSPSVAVPDTTVLDADGHALPFVCPTTEVFQDRVGRTEDLFSRACPQQGTCDDPGVRDGTSTASRTVDVIVHVMRSNSGTAPNGVTQSTVNAGISQLNSDYAGSGIQFNLAATRFHNDSDYFCIRRYSPRNTNWLGDINAMKSAYAEDPANQCNIFISCQDSSPWGVLLGIGTFPWDPTALTATGGLWVNSLFFGAGQKTVSHEMGHCLGLWHTQHGVSEVSSCGSCYEFASGSQGDVRGDFCSDTPPTPTNYNCAAPGGSDCQSTSWGATQPENYMGYGPDSCIDTFTNQQARRMHCWTSDALAGWSGGGQCTDPVPSAPSGLSATAASDSRIDLAWTDNSSVEDGVEVQRDSGSGFSTVANLGANATSYSDTGLDCETSYSYRVRASNCAGASSFSNTDPALTGTCPAGPVMHVSAIDMSISGNRNKRARATVTIVDQGGSPVSGATVSGSFSGTTSSSESGVTGSNGQVTLQSDRSRASTYCWTLTVTNVTAAGATYDSGANVETSDSVGNGCGARILARGGIPATPSLLGNVPNPFGAATDIAFALPSEQSVRIEIYDVAGRRIAELLDGTRSPGLHEVTWNGRDVSGLRVAPGTYFARLITAGSSDTRKLTVLE